MEGCKCRYDEFFINLVFSASLKLQILKIIEGTYAYIMYII